MFPCGLPRSLAIYIGTRDFYSFLIDNAVRTSVAYHHCTKVLVESADANRMVMAKHKQRADSLPV
jgi:hypothetical protein